jgi:PAS domain S-box-containing protein
MTNTLNCVPDALLATNSCGDVLYMNPRAEQLTGWRVEEALRRCSSDVFHLMDGRGSRLESPLREAYVEEEVYRCADCFLAAADGDRTRIQYTAAPIRTEEGEVVGAVVVFREKEQAREGI